MMFMYAFIEFLTHISNRKTDWSMKLHWNVLDNCTLRLQETASTKLTCFVIGIVRDHNICTSRVLLIVDYSLQRGCNNMASDFELHNVHLYRLTSVSERL